MAWPRRRVVHQRRVWGMAGAATALTSVCCESVDRGRRSGSPGPDPLLPSLIFGDQLLRARSARLHLLGHVRAGDDVEADFCEHLLVLGVAWSLDSKNTDLGHRLDADGP